VDADGLHFTGLIFGKSDDIPTGLLYAAICMLCLALVWATWRQNIKALLEMCVFEVKNQFGCKK
jgi:hypothetical protein